MLPTLAGTRLIGRVQQGWISEHRRRLRHAGPCLGIQLLMCNEKRGKQFSPTMTEWVATSLAVFARTEHAPGLEPWQRMSLRDV